MISYNLKVHIYFLPDIILERGLGSLNSQWIKCQNEYCNNQVRVQLNSKVTKPILFCTELCLNTVFNKSQKLDPKFDSEDPNELRNVIQNLVSQTKLIQNELENLRTIRKTYFGLFKDNKLKDEIYKRDWTFKDEVKD